MAKKFTFTWTIANYSKLVLKKNEYIKSPTFVTDQGHQEWNLELYPNGDSAVPDYLSCNLRKTAGLEAATVKYTFNLLSPEGKLMFEDDFSDTFDDYTEWWGSVLTPIKSLREEMNGWTSDVLTVQCVMNIENSNADSDCDLKAKSEIGFNLNTFKWCIKEPDSSEWVQRKIFNCTEETSLEVILTTAEDDILIEVKNKSEIDVGYQCVTTKISVIDVNNVKRLSIKDVHNTRGKSDNSWKLPIFITKKTLIEKKCIKNGFFTVIFEFSVPNKIITGQIKESIEYEFMNPQITQRHSDDAITALHNALEQMLLIKKHSDVTLKAEGELFCAHKCILSVRSPVFRAMFDSDMIENKSNVVDIKDLDSVTLGSLLKFLYAGTIDVSKYENILNLMLAADKYQVETLTEKCSEILIPLMTLNNVCDVIAMADSVKHNALKEFAFDLILKNAKFILSSSTWVEWSKTNLALAFEISSKLALEFANKLS